jgi:protein involved in polysaccharide export with SLBB domain
MFKPILVAVFLSLTALPAMAQVLQPGDGVRIKFYNINETDISGDFYIQQNGILQLPYIGRVEVENRDYPLIQSEIKTRYDSLYKGVELIVQPLFRISVLGEVGTPGVYYVTGI